MNVPIISLEVQGMRHTIKVALDRHSAEMDQYIQEALDRYCEPNNIQAVVHQAATRAIDAAVKTSIEHFFRYGKGRAVVKEVVEQRLAEEWSGPVGSLQE